MLSVVHWRHNQHLDTPSQAITHPRTTHSANHHHQQQQWQQQQQQSAASGVLCTRAPYFTPPHALIILFISGRLDAKQNETRCIRLSVDDIVELTQRPVDTSTSAHVNLVVGSRGVVPEA